MKISETDLILNPDGSVYHLNLRPEDIADIIITVGDPDRVALVSKYFDKVEIKKQKREFITHTGFIGSRAITVLSTGIGTDNVDIVMNELDALANINLAERTVKIDKKKLKIIRIGTSGTLRPEIATDSLLASEYGLGLDTLAAFYDFPQTNFESRFCEALHKKMNFSFMPSMSAASADLLNIFSAYKRGLTASSPGFYAPQGRRLRGKVKNESLLETLAEFTFEEKFISNFEMETSAYYALGNLLGHDCLSLNAIVANRTLRRFSANPYATVEKLIVQVLEKIADKSTFN